ncbi:MAG: hypothetical protein AAFO87_18080 [Cyanobacteria bacterium J06607_6]
MMPGGWLTGWLTPSFGSETGAGMAVLYATCAIAMLLVGIGGCFSSQLQAIATSQPKTQ